MEEHCTQNKAERAQLEHVRADLSFERESGAQQSAVLRRKLAVKGAQVEALADKVAIQKRVCACHCFQIHQLVATAVLVLKSCNQLVAFSRALVPTHSQRSQQARE